MNELHRLADKLQREQEILDLMDWAHKEHTPEQIRLGLDQAKRVRRASNLLIRALAQERDNLQPGGTR